MRGPAALVVLLLGLALAAPPASAQVELDGSMTGTSGLVPGGDGATYLIQESYGRRSGPNLFHSFSRFDIPFAQSAAFTGDAGIERVVGRVTGGTVSQINGALRNTIVGADLYLMNPRGFLFSSTASLDLHGSLYLSSANTLRFEDGVVFPATAQSDGVLSAAPPSAWGFSTDSTASPITFINARNLAVPGGETLSVVGAGIVVRGASSSTTLRAPGGTIALASRSAPGEVPVDVGNLSARDAAIDELGPVSVANAFLDVSDPTNLAPSRGRIVIRAGALTVDSSVLSASSAADAATDAPDVDLETTRSIVLRRNSGLDAAARGSAVGGGVRISSESIALSGASSATTSASDLALAGELEVDTGTLGLSESARLATSATGDATVGRISVSAASMAAAAGAQIASINGATTDAPAIEISVEDVLQLGSGASVVSQALAAGRGAALQISATSLEQSGGARIETSSFGDGGGGDIDIDVQRADLAGDPLGTVPGGVFASSFGSGDAGHIGIAAEQIRVAGGAQVSATAEGAGRGGDIDVAAVRSLELSGASLVGPSGVFARSGLGPQETTATGDGGNIVIEAATVVVREGAEISAATYGTGNAGGVSVDALESVVVTGGPTSNSSISAKAWNGNGGDIVIEAGELRVDDGGEITVSTLRSGASGNIEIEADRVFVGSSSETDADPAGIFAQSLPEQGAEREAGDAGNIEIRATRLVELRNAGVISAQTRGSGDAGTVRIVAPVVNVTDGASVSALSGAQGIDDAGSAGGVEIVAAQSLRIAGGATTGSSITAQGASGEPGDITIQTGELRVENGGVIGASTRLDGRSGDIFIEANRVYVGGGAASVSVDAAILAQSTWPDRIITGGRGGDIDIRATEIVRLSDRGSISVNTLGVGAAGNLTIAGTELVTIDDGEISARSEGSGAAGSVTLDGVGELIVGAGGSIATETLADGPGGSIAINANQQVLVMNGGTISARSEGTGDAGNITIEAGQRFSARNGGQVTTSAVAADGGDIEIGASRLIYIQDGRVTTDVRAGLGSGGNITLDPEFVVLNHAELRASAVGDGGNITIVTDRFVRDSSSVVDASSELGIDGEIQTTSPTVDLTSELVQLDTSFLDASSKLAAACAARAGQRGTFAVRGRTRAVSPEAPLGSTNEEPSQSDCDQLQP